MTIRELIGQLEDLAEEHGDGVEVRLAMAKSKRIEAHGVKGAKSTPWRKTFKSIDALLKWATSHDAEIYATRELD